MPTNEIGRVIAYVVCSGFMLGFTIVIIAIWCRWSAASKEKTLIRKLAANLGFILKLYGFNAFFLLQLLTMSGLILSVPKNWNLPMGYAQCVHDPSQQRFCVSFTGRVQKYDSDGVFLKGWSSEVFGGSAKIRKTKEGTIQLLTRRQSALYTFDGDGNLLSTQTDMPREMFNRTNDKTQYVSTWFPLLPLTHPYIGLFTLMLGVLVTRIEDRGFWRSELQRSWKS